MIETITTEGRYRQAPSLGDTAYTELKERLSRGVYKPGDKLTVRSVAEALGVSSTPARDAINRLVADSAVVYAGPKTVIVPVLTEADLREITLIRIALEGLAAQLSVEHCQPGTIEALQEIQSRINAALDSGGYQQALWHNKEFHFHVDDRVPVVEGRPISLWSLPRVCRSQVWRAKPRDGDAGLG